MFREKWLEEEDLSNGLSDLLVFSLNDLPGISCGVFHKGYFGFATFDRAGIPADRSSCKEKLGFSQRRCVHHILVT